jgi:predicted ester cyclase
MTTQQLKARTLEGFERMFNNGEVDYVETGAAPGAVDHQEPAGTDFVAHLKEVIVTLRRAFPDLRFDVHEILAEGLSVACRSTMTGTHQGPLNIGPMAALPVTGARIEVPHMHFFHYDEQGRVTDLWHVWTRCCLPASSAPPRPICVSGPRREHRSSPDGRRAGVNSRVCNGRGGLTR